MSIVGFLTAIIAFGIVRLEQWLFDIKEGRCLDGWHKAKRFCCPPLGPGDIVHPGLANGTSPAIWNSPLQPFSVTGLNFLYPSPPSESFNPYAKVMPCADWVTWAEQSGLRDEEMEWIVEYAAYTVLAVSIGTTWIHGRL